MKKPAHEVILSQLEDNLRVLHTQTHELFKSTNGMVSVQTLYVLGIFHSAARVLLVTLFNMKMPDDVRIKVADDLDILLKRFPIFGLFLPFDVTKETILKKE